jgi:hypothetical protein
MNRPSSTGTSTGIESTSKVYYDGTRKFFDKNKVPHPPYYLSETGLEVIDVIEAFTFNLKGIEAFDTGNVIKYACRWKNKDGVQDLKKLIWYAQHLIDHLEKSKSSEENI